MGLYLPVAVLAGLALLVAGLMRLGGWKGERTVKDGVATCVFGRKGAGKSLFMVHEALRCIGRPQRCKVCSFDKTSTVNSHRVHVAANFDLILPEELRPYFIRLPSERDAMVHVLFREVEGRPGEYESGLPHLTLVLIDEMALWFPARAGSMSLPKMFQGWVQMLRRFHHELIYVAHDFSRVNKGVRDLTDEAAYLRKGLLGVRTVTTGDISDVRKLEQWPRPKGFRPHEVYRFRITAAVTEAFNTHEIVMLTMPERRRERRVPAGGAGMDDGALIESGLLVPWADDEG